MEWEDRKQKVEDICHAARWKTSRRERRGLQMAVERVMLVWICHKIERGSGARVWGGEDSCG